MYERAMLLLFLENERASEEEAETKRRRKKMEILRFPRTSTGSFYTERENGGRAPPSEFKWRTRTREHARIIVGDKIEIKGCSDFDFVIERKRRRNKRVLVLLSPSPRFLIS